MTPAAVIFLLAVSSAASSTERLSETQKALAITSPIIQMRLEPPLKSHPQVTAELHELETSRKTMESTFHARLIKTATAAFQAAKTRIDAIVSKHRHDLSMTRVSGLVPSAQMGFINSDAHHSTVGADDTIALRLHVFPLSFPPQKIQDQLDSIEGKLTMIEQRLLEQADEEMKHITDIVLSEASTRLNKLKLHAERSSTHTRQSAFLETQGTSRMVDVRIAPATKAFPTIRSLAEAMEERLDASERQELDFILKTERDLFTAEVDYLVSSLQHV